MKKFLLGLFILVSVSAQSQVLITLLLGDKLNSPGVEFGLEGGMNWTQISGFETKTFARKWNLGFYFNVRIKNQWSLYTGVLVKSNMGVDKFSSNDLGILKAKIYKDTAGQLLEGNYGQKMNVFMVPVLLRYNFKNHMFFALGPQFSLMYKSWIEFESDLDRNEVLIKEYNKEDLNKIDIGAMVAFGYRMLKGTGWTISAKYYYGFINAYKDIPKTKNSSIFVELDIPIGAGKKPKKED
jgi:hypothetical protein